MQKLGQANKPANAMDIPLFTGNCVSTIGRTAAKAHTHYSIAALLQSGDLHPKSTPTKTAQKVLRRVIRRYALPKYCDDGEC
jgi:hypothetical protein